MTGTSKVVPHVEGTPNFKTQAEYEIYRAEQAKKTRAGKSKSEPAPPAPAK